MTAVLTPDLCVIGAGAGGLAVAAGAAQLGAEVVLIERGAMGGDCLNFGCVPSKSLLAAAHLAALGHRGGKLGIHYEPPRIDFAAVADSVAQVVAGIAPHDSAERFKGLGVRVLRAEARFTSPRTACAADALIRARRFVVATGSEPFIPPIPGLALLPYLTNETVFANRVRPDHLIVIGGGAVGIELAQAHCRLGARVTVLDLGPLLPREDRELAGLLARRLAGEGIALRPEVEIAAVEGVSGDLRVRLAGGGQIAGSHLLVAAGRRPALSALDLAAAGIAAGAQGIAVDRRLRTTNRRVFALGDVAGGPQFTHAALYQAGIVIRNALFRLPVRVDYRALPRVVFTDPELAQVGLGEDGAGAAGRNVRTLRWPFAENDRARAERDAEGLVKIVVGRGGRVLGASILGAGAGDLILPWALAIAQRLRIGALASLVVPYPTRGEAGRRAAGDYFAPTLFSARTQRLVRLLAAFG